MSPTAIYFTKDSTRRVHLVVPGTHHGSFHSDGYGASGHIYTPSDDYTLCGNMVRFSRADLDAGFSTTGETTTDGAKSTCKTCTKRYAALNGSQPERFACLVLTEPGTPASYVSRISPFEFTADVAEAIQFDNADVGVSYVVHFNPTFAFDVVRV